MEKLILRCFLSPGDVVMLTAAVRDLHLCYPGRFATDVRTACPSIWEHNPFITPLPADAPDAKVLDCAYPLINQSNVAPYHCLHGFIEFLNEKLGLRIRPTLFKGDIHLADEERRWFSQVHELIGEDILFWIIGAGGKYDVTIKWWDASRYQAVVDHFRGKIQFVQVGAHGHFHPRLDGVIDLRGKTDLRQLIRLVYHSQGVLCPVTALMHLAAAVQQKGSSTPRPCVVIAGGREPAHWEAYPDHQFLAANGTLSCCQGGGCWRSRTQPLGDGDERDRPEHLCLQRVGDLPRCMDLITAGQVIQSIERYFEGGALSCLAKDQTEAAERAIELTKENDFDQAPLTLHNARLAMEKAQRTVQPYPDRYQGRGIVICGGGLKYFTNAWVCIRMLRKLECRLPIELWHCGEDEIDGEMRTLIEPYGVQCVDATEIAQEHPIRRLGGWELKAYAIVHSKFEEVLFLDADNVPVINPEDLFDIEQYRTSGAVFWPDLGQFAKTSVIWECCGLVRPPDPEFESGQMLIHKRKCWEALLLALWFNENSDFFYQHLHGDKETFHLAFHKVKKSYGFVDVPIERLAGTMCQHDFSGERVFQHRNTDKWDFLLCNKRVEGFWFEEDCRKFIRELQTRWDGRMKKAAGTRRIRGVTSSPRISAVMISCARRNEIRERTLANLAASDWGDEPVIVAMDESDNACPKQRQTQNALLALRRASELNADFILFLEDDLEFNAHLRRNLHSWKPLKWSRLVLAGLYNPGLRERAADSTARCRIIRSEDIFGSQALVIPRRTLRFILEHWNEVEGMQDIRISRLAGRLKGLICCHAPSLVQHTGTASVWGGPFHQAWDFDRDWK